MNTHSADVLHWSALVEQYARPDLRELLRPEQETALCECA